MTYGESQRRKARAYIGVGLTLGIASLSIFVVALIKAAYIGCPHTLGLCALVILPVNKAYQYVVVRWFWALIPDAVNGFWWSSLLSPIGFLAVFCFLFSTYLNRKGRALKVLIDTAWRNAETRRISESYHPSKMQTIGSINAGGDVRIDQSISNNPALKNWEKKFFNSPIGLIIVAVVGGVLTLLLSKWLGLSQ